jgi:hypothetical protein
MACADIPLMGAVAVDVLLELEALHSELPFVCPELRKRALELLPEREPYAFLPRQRPAVAVSSTVAPASSGQRSVLGEVAAYAGTRVLQTLKFGLPFAAALGAFAMLAELAQ